MQLSRNLTHSFFALLSTLLFLGATQHALATENLKATITLVKQNQVTVLAANIPLRKAVRYENKKHSYQVVVTQKGIQEFGGQKFNKYQFTINKKVTGSHNNQKQTFEISDDMLNIWAKKEREFVFARMDGGEFILTVAVAT